MATILIVDDRPANREYLVTLLGYGGHRLLEAADGAEALVTARTVHLELVIADILMPTMDGYEFVRRLRADPVIRAIPVIFCTAHYHEREARALADACGVAHVLTKPVDPEVVLRTVDAALGVTPSPAPSPPAAEFDREHLRLLTDKLSQKAEEVRTTNERLTALIDLGLQFGSEREPQRLLQSFCQAAREIIGARYAVVGVLDEDGLHLRHCITSGIDAETAARLGSPDPRQGVLGTVLNERRCCRLSNPGGDPSGVGLSSFGPLRSFLAAPIVSPAHVYGWLCLIDKLGGEEFSPEDERLAGTLARQVGRIYENGSLLADVVRHTAELEREVFERRKAERRLSVQNAVALVLAESGTVREAIPRMLQSICECLAWEWGVVWRVDPEEQVLRCEEIWHVASASFTQFKTLCWQTCFPSGIGLPGRVWANGQPTWIADVVADDNFPRGAVAAQAGMHGAFGFPIRRGGEILGVMEFFSRDIRQPDPDLLQMMDTIGSHIGQFIERERAEEAVRHSEARKSAILSVCLDAVITMDHEGTIRGFNPAAERIFGYAEAEALGKPLAELIVPPSLRQQHLQGLARYLATGEGTILDQRLEMAAMRADGSEFAAELTVTRIPVEGRPMFTGYLRDITERRRVEAARARLIAILEATPDLVAITQVEGPVSYINAAGRRLLGLAADEEVSLLDHRPERARKVILEEAIPTAIREGVWSGETVLLSKSEEEIPVSQVLIAHQGPSGAVEFLSTIARDIRGQKRLEEQLRQAQKMEAVGSLAGGVAHDFNNLLTIIKGYGELLLASLPGGDPTRELIQEMVAAGDRAAALTRQLLAFSRKAILDPKVLDLKATVADVEKMLRRIIGEDIQLVTLADPDLGSVKADPGHIEQVILNLVVNARDAMPQGGQLTIEVHNAELDESYAHDHPEARPGPHVLLAVTDSGCGMDASTLARIWEPFFTTKGENGTGLGLATVYGIVKQSGGHVAVYSEVGHGTTFKVYLPRVEERLRSGKSHPGEKVMPHGDETLLLVEDEAGLRALTRHVLKGCGYTVLEACDGAEAMTVAGQYRGRIDLLVTDVVMPRMGGREVAERLATTHPGIKVLFLSGYTNDAVVRHGILEAEVAFLQKPFSPASLVGKVREVLDGEVEGDPVI